MSFIDGTIIGQTIDFEHQKGETRGKLWWRIIWGLLEANWRMKR